MTILRGFDFAPNDLATAARLYDLVANARFTNVDWAAAMVSGLSVVAPSTPSNPGIGALWHEMEPIVGFTASLYSAMDPIIAVWSPQGKVALFASGALESRVMCNGDVNAIPIGRAAMAQSAAAQSGVTLYCRPAWGAGGAGFNSPLMGVLGATWNFTAATGPSISGFPRLRMFGMALVNMDAGNIPPALPFPAYTILSRTGGSVSQFTASTCSVCTMADAILLEQRSNSVALAYFLGGPSFRTG